MSVLYKALEKAARQNARGEPGSMAAAEAGGMGATAVPPGAPPLTPGATMDAANDPTPRRGRTIVRVLALVFLLITAAVMAGVMLFQDEVETLLIQATGGTPVVLQPPPPVVQPAPEPQQSAAAPVEQPAPAPEPPATPVEAEPAETPEAPTAVSAPAEVEPAAEPVASSETPSPEAQAPEGVARAEPTATAQPEPVAAVDDNIAALMAEGARRRGLATPAVADVPATDPAPVAPPAPDRLGAEDVLRAGRGADAALATGAPVTIDTGTGMGRAGLANVSVSSVPRVTRDTLAGGYGALMRGNYAAALNAYDSVLEREPDNVSALSGRAAALHKLGMADQARATYERVLARDPENREALTNMVALLGDADPVAALEELQRLQAVAPDFSPIAAQIGMLHARMGRVGEALGALRRAVSLSPENALYHYNIAVVSDRAGRVAEAARAYERVLRLIEGGGAPGGLRAQPIRDRLRYLRARL